MGKDGARRWRRRARQIPLPPVAILPMTPAPSVDLEPEGRRGRRRRRWLRRPRGRSVMVAGLVLSLGLLATGVTAVVTHAGPAPDAGVALRRAKLVVEGSDSFRFQMLETARVVTGDGRRAGSDTTTRTFASGTVEARNRWHLVQELDESSGLDAEQFEAIRVGSTMYATTGIFEEGGAGPAWTAGSAAGMRFDIDDAVDLYQQVADEEGVPFLGEGGADPDALLLDLVILGHVYSGSAEPSTLGGVIERATDPSFATELPGGGMRLDARLPAIAALADLTEDPVRVRMELDLDTTGAPTRVELAARYGGASLRVVIRFRGWGDDHSVAPPAEEDVDRTPWVSEEALEALDPELLLAPAEVPDGFALVAAAAGAGDTSSLGCPSLDLEYEGGPGLSDPESLDELAPEDLDELFADAGFLTISVTTPECAAEYDDSPFDLELGGLPARGGDGYWEVEVASAVVYLETSLDEAAAGVVAASIAPTTVDDLVGALAEGPGGTAGPGPFVL